MAGPRRRRRRSDAAGGRRHPLRHPRPEWMNMSESLRLFVVEDNDDIAFVTRLCLERAGHQVTVCHSGTDALIVLGQVSYDLVVLDSFLEDMKGSDLLHRLPPDRTRTPVLMIS